MSIESVLKTYGQIGVELVKMDLQKVNATGKTIDSVKYTVDSDNHSDRLLITAREYTHLLNDGRGPTTKGPSPEMIQNLTEYARARGFQDPKKAAWAIAKKINKEGDKTFRQGGRDIYESDLDRFIQEVQEAVMDEFGKNVLNSLKNSFDGSVNSRKAAKL